MKNLKKVLSLVLALAMAMSLMTAAFAADASKLGDYNKVSHNEAVDVVAAVGVMVGDANGNYNPTDVLDRASAAKIIAYLTLGEETAEDLEASGTMFTDVPASHWAAKYIEYCATKGYITGNGAGLFYPNAKLTGFQFAKMLLCALGYDAEYEHMTGDAWEINTSILANKQSPKTFKNTDGKASANLTRENAAEMILNALQTQTVTANKGTTTIVNGVSVTTGSQPATKNNTTLKNELYGTDKNDADKLIKKDSNVTDDFGRAAYEWWYDGEKIGTYASEADYVLVLDDDYTGRDEATTIANLLKFAKDELNNNKLDITSAVTYVNGEYNGLSSAYQMAKAGAILELFMDDDNDNKVVRVVAYAYEIAQITEVDTDVKDTDAEDGVSAYITVEGITDPINNTDIPGYDKATYVEDAYIAAVVNASEEIIASYVPEVVKNVSLTAIANDKVTAKVGSTTYTSAGDSKFDSATVGKDYAYDLYLDKNGYVLLADEVEEGEATLDDVYYVVGTFNKDTTNDYNESDNKHYVQVVDLKGTISTVEIAEDAADNLIGKLVTFKSVKDETYKDITAFTTASTDKYTVGEDSSVTLKADAKRLGSLYVDAKTNYIVVETEKDSSDALILSKTEASVKVGGVAYTGADVVTVSSKDGNTLVANYVIVANGTATNTAYTDKLYVKDTTTYDVTEDGNVFTVYNAKGEKVEVLVDDSVTTLTAGFNTYEIDEDGIYTLAGVSGTDVIGLTDDTAWDDDTTGVAAGVSFVSLYNGMMTVKDGTYSLTDIAAAGAVVVDIHDTDATGQYDKTVKTLGDLDNLLNSTKNKITSATISVDIDEDGAVIVFITNVVAK